MNNTTDHRTQATLRETVRAGRLVLVEEAARDGAQGKTLLLAPQRIELARRTAAVLGRRADECLVTMVGFPAIGLEECRVIEEVVAEVEVGYQQVVTRAIAADVRQGLDLMRKAHRGRLIYVVPGSDPMAAAMLRCSAREALDRGAELLSLALEQACGEVAVDVCLADMGAADPGLVREGANRFTAMGAEAVMLADTTGGMHPLEFQRTLEGITRGLDPEVVVHGHFHNDLGLALGHNLHALSLGHRVLGTSWLGLGERSGLGRTEELLGLLAAADEAQLASLATSREQLGVDAWDVHQVVPAAEWLAQELGMQLRVSDPFVGSGVNTISTGTPFVAPRTFMPYDPEQVLGVEPRLVLTHLASARVISAVGAQLGLDLSREEITHLLSWVKARAYAEGNAVVAQSLFAQEVGRMRWHSQRRPWLSAAGS